MCHCREEERKESCCNLNTQCVSAQSNNTMRGGGRGSTAGALQFLKLLQLSHPFALPRKGAEAHTPSTTITTPPPPPAHLLPDWPATTSRGTAFQCWCACSNAAASASTSASAPGGPTICSPTGSPAHAHKGHDRCTMLCHTARPVPSTLVPAAVRPHGTDSAGRSRPLMREQLFIQSMYVLNLCSPNSRGHLSVSQQPPKAEGTHTHAYLLTQVGWAKQAVVLKRWCNQSARSSAGGPRSTTTGAGPQPHSLYTRIKGLQHDRRA